MTKRFIWGDVESTGLSKDAGVVEIAWIETDDQFNVLAQHRSLIKPGVPIEFGAMGVHGITEDMVKDAPTIDQFMEATGNTLTLGEVVLCCHNLAFDQKFFAPFLPDGHMGLCTLKCARNLYPKAENHKLQTLKCMFGLQGDHDKAHTALEDVSVMLQFAQHMCRDHELTLHDLLEVQTRKKKIDAMSFGKHKGTKLVDLPKSYVSWMLKEATNLDPDLRSALEAL